MQTRPDTMRDAASQASIFPDPEGHTEVFHLGDFAVFPATRVLLRNDSEISIGSRAFDLLVVLLEARGRMVEKVHIQRRVWPSTIVDDCNIRVQISYLRKVLGPGASIKTIPGRGYLLTGQQNLVAKAWHPVWPCQPTASASFPDWLSKDGRRQREGADSVHYVAIVDDDAFVLDSMAGLIESAGFEVAAFSSLAAFLNSVQSRPPGCLVLDAWLPGQRGLEFQANLRTAGIRLPIVFISGNADIAMSVRAIKAGAFDFLTKPVRHDDLLNAISLAMANPV